jgi:carnitine O-acetyltransferase
MHTRTSPHTLAHAQYDEKRKLFRQALTSQSQYMRDCAAGKGIDRHLLGLYAMATPEERATSLLFTDPSYAKTTHFRLSTSNMSPGTHFWGGFGPVAKDGYGINYAIGGEDLKFSISAKRSCKETSAFELRLALEKTLRDLMILFPKR